MARVHRYRPSPILLPGDSGLSRTFFKKLQHLEGRPLLEDSDYEDYDTHGIFHDLFIDADGSCLRAVGPPLVNLKKELLPLTLTVTDMDGTPPESKPLKHKLNSRFRLSRHQFSLPSLFQGADQLKVKLEFANGLFVEQVACRQKLKPVTLQFSTLQKDNPVSWIVDWIRYCHTLGVERILLYDNGSNYEEDLEDVFLSLDLDIEIVLINWPFIYGPRRSYYNRFTQATQNNHSYQCFGNAIWTGHFDIDEFLVVPLAGGLMGLLGSVSSRVGLLRFNSYLLPNVRENPDAMPSARDFRYRFRWLHMRAYKYIARNKAITLAKIHNGYVKLGYYRIRVEPEEAVFHHCQGLTTNWRRDDPRQYLANLEPDKHVEDLTLVKKFEQIDSS